MNPYLKRLQKKEANSHGKTSEKRVIKGLGGKQTPNSGAVRGAKGDGKVGDWMVEAKSTVNNSMAIELGWLTKLTVEAFNEKKLPALAVSFVHPTGMGKPGGDWVMIPAHLFRELVE